MDQESANKIIRLGYWNVRGRGEPIRLLLNYLKVDYEDVVYSLDNREEWFNKKQNSSELFMNLPYVEIVNKDNHSDVIKTIVESESISVYICQNFGGENLIGNDLVLLNKMRGVVEDVKYYLSRYAYHKDFVEADQIFLQKRLLPILLRINTYLSVNNTYLLGNHLSYLDFILYESFMTLKKINSSYLEQYPLILQYINNIENLEQIKQYLSSTRFHKDFLFYGDPSPI